MDLSAIAKRAIACLDLTNLDDNCNEEAIALLCRRAVTPFGNVAAVCVWPDFVKQSVDLLRPKKIKVATVVNFPTGEDPISKVIDETEQAVADGVDEIDMVIPWKMLMEGHPENIPARVARVKSAAGDRTVKAILETGMLQDKDLIQQASILAIDGGADFIKTSTGKVRYDAIPRAVEIMLKVIRDHNTKVGIKPSGGMKTTQDIAVYFDLADKIMGPKWATSDRFRIGASSVINNLIATAQGEQEMVKDDEY